ncbi:MAG: MmgE/PrpD family protein [Betaproteobacteria bacterium]
MPGLTSSLAEFVHAPVFGALPERAIAIVQSGFIDTIAAMIAGRDEPVVGIVKRFVAARGAQAGESSLLGGSERIGSAQAVT